MGLWAIPPTISDGKATIGTEAVVAFESWLASEHAAPQKTPCDPWAAER
jgi:hypothetical protein